MDTDDLSPQSHKAILVQAEKFHEDLTLQFGLLCGECSNEAEFIRQSVRLINRMKRMKKSELPELFFGSQQSAAAFHLALDKILKNIALLK